MWVMIFTKGARGGPNPRTKFENGSLSTDDEVNLLSYSTITRDYFCKENDTPCKILHKNLV